MFKNKLTGKKLVVVILLLVSIFVSQCSIVPYVTNAANRSKSIEILDDMKIAALGFTTTVTATSFIVSAMPDDTGSSIANELADLSDILMLIVCVIYLEKFLLTTTGYFSFAFLIPAASLIFTYTLFYPNEKWRSLSIKILVFALLLFFLIPASTEISDLVQKTFDESIQKTFATVDKFATEVEQTQNDSNFLQRLWDGIENAVNNWIGTSKKVLSALTDAVAVLLIKACIIPVLTIFVFVWSIRKLFGWQVNISIPKTLSRHLPQADTTKKLPENS